MLTSDVTLWFLQSVRLLNLVGNQEMLPGIDHSGGSSLTSVSKATAILVKFFRDPLGLVAVATVLLNLCMKISVKRCSSSKMILTFSYELRELYFS